VPRAKRDPNQCPTCGRVGRHTATCPLGKCVSFQGYPATCGSLCSVCWRRMVRERKAAIAEKLNRLEGP
jgi:hypothetical protein